MNITVIGTIFTDIKGHPFEAFIPGGRNPGFIEYVHGGVGRNIAEDLAALGDRAVLVSLADPGGAGDDVIAHLSAAGVDTRFIGRTQGGSGTWLAVFDEKGEVVSSVSARADLTSLADLIEAHHEELFSRTDLIILEADIDAASVEKVFEYAARYDRKICCAVAVMGEALDHAGAINRADLFICNQQEAGMLLGKDLTDRTPEEVLAEVKGYISGTGLKNFVVTMSARGSVYAGTGGCGVCPAVPAEAADTTGAGDSYCAGLCAALARGASLGDACMAGAKVSSFVVADEKNIYSGPPLKELSDV